MLENYEDITQYHEDGQYVPLFQYFGGKSAVSEVVWQRLGDVDCYTEPFFGSGAVLFKRPAVTGERTETVNDAHCFIANFWRAVDADPDAVAKHCDWPANEIDLTARHVWLVNRMDEVRDRMWVDPDFFDAKAAGWWCWGLCWWIGSGWCDGKGPWNIDADGKLGKVAGGGVSKRRPHLGDDGRGVCRQRPHLDNGKGACDDYSDFIRAMVRRASNRLRRVRVCCGDWVRVVTPSAAGYPPSERQTVGIFLDPPYSAEADRDMRCYATDCGKVAHDVRDWCKTVADDRRLRIALCGYEGEHDELERMGWSVYAWKANGGMANQGNNKGKVNAGRERIWFSPHCLTGESKPTLFCKEATA